MNKQNYNNLKFKYKFIFTLVVLIAGATSAYPTWEVSVAIADYFNISADEPVKDNPNGWYWLISFFAVGILNFLVANITIAFLICKMKGWSYKQGMDYFVRYENLPAHWSKL